MSRQRVENEVQTVSSVVLPRFVLDVFYRHTAAAEDQGEEFNALPVGDFLEVRRILQALQRVSEFQVNTTSFKWFNIDAHR